MTVEPIEDVDLMAALREFLDRLCITVDLRGLHSVTVTQRGVRLTYVNDTGAVAMTHIEEHPTAVVDDLTGSPVS